MNISQARFLGVLLTVVLFSLAACGTPVSDGVAPTSSKESSPLPVKIATSDATGTSTPTCPAGQDLKRPFLDVLGTDPASCFPDQTRQSIGVYLYDLDKDAELVSINADIPFQFASAFKGPLLVYFLDNCRKYWDTTSPAWMSFFLEPAPVFNVDMYTSEAYRQILVNYLADVANWETIQDFSMKNRTVLNGQAGPLDQRYFILNQAFSMVTQSNNAAAGIVLKFTFENCLADQPALIEQKCGGPNAITEFNRWFSEYSKIEYAPGEEHRGLNSWDNILSTDSNGNVEETKMVTSGLIDACVIQSAYLDCSRTVTPSNAWTARDLFRFYSSLFHENDKTLNNTAMEILKIDRAGISRGYLKNMARRMDAVSMSKNGSYGDIFADAGIFEYQQRHYVVATLTYDALDSVIALYGQYNMASEPLGDKKGLIQALLEGDIVEDQVQCSTD